MAAAGTLTEVHKSPEYAQYSWVRGAGPSAGDSTTVIQTMGYDQAEFWISSSAGTHSSGTYTVGVAMDAALGGLANEDAGRHKRSGKTTAVSNSGYMRSLPPFIHMVFQAVGAGLTDVTVTILLKPSSSRNVGRN